MVNILTNQAVFGAIKRYRPCLAILFGSQARGDATGSSDADLVLVKDTSDNFFDRLKKFALMLPPEAPQIDTLIYTPDEFNKIKDWGTPLIQRVIKEGKIIYEAPK